MEQLFTVAVTATSSEILLYRQFGPGGHADSAAASGSGPSPSYSGNIQQ